LVLKSSEVESQHIGSCSDLGVGDAPIRVPRQQIVHRGVLLAGTGVCSVQARLKELRVKELFMFNLTGVPRP